MKHNCLPPLKFPLVAFLFLALHAQLFAQYWQTLPEDKADQKSREALKNADYIFEGYAKGNYTSYYNEDSTEILTSVELNVIHCYKGNLQTGTIELIRPMRDEHTTGIETKTRYIFLCQKTNLLRRNSPIFDNFQTVQLYNEYVPCLKVVDKTASKTQVVGGLFNRYFPTKDSFHVFLKQSSGEITLPPTLNKTPPSNPSGNPLAPTIQKPDTTSNKGNYRLGGVNETLHYSVRNQRVYYENGKNFYAFDLYGQVLVTGLNLVESFAVLRFSRATFGANPNPSYRWKGKVGSGLPQGSVTVSGSNTPNDTTIEVRVSPLSYSLPNDTFMLATVYLEIGLDTVCCEWPELAFLTGSEYASYYTTNPAVLLDFEVEFSPIPSYKLCTQPMSITSVSPLLVHAGNGEILEIRGKGFGATKGEVLFKNADIGGVENNIQNGFLNGLDSIWIDTWSDTLLKIKVPSFVTRGYNGEIFTAGSGPVMVKQSPCGDTLRSTQKANIEYAFINYADQSQQTYIIDKFYIPKRFCVNGFVFTFDTSIQHHPNGYLMIGAMNEAFIRWSNQLGITLTYEENAAGTAPFFTANRADPERNVIYLSNATQAMSYFPVRVSTDNANGIKKYYKDKIDIKINPTADWGEYSTSGILELNEQDFFWAFLHELGHALGLDHDIDLINKAKNMMNYNILASSPAADRANLVQWSDRAIKGAKDIVAQSKTKTWNPPVLETLSNLNSTIVPAPSISPTGAILICCGTDNKTLTASHPTETTGWLWFPNSETTQAITTNKCGEYRVRIAPIGCSKASPPSAPTFLKSKPCSTTGEPHYPSDEGRLTIQPNPASYFVSIHYEEALATENHRIQIFSANGSLIETVNVTEGSGDITLYISNWATGSYWVTFRNDSAVIDTDELVIAR